VRASPAQRLLPEAVKGLLVRREDGTTLVAERTTQLDGRRNVRSDLREVYPRKILRLISGRCRGATPLEVGEQLHQNPQTHKKKKKQGGESGVNVYLEGVRARFQKWAESTSLNKEL